MQSELVLENEPRLSYRLSGAPLLSKLMPICFWAFLIITALAVFIPLNPSMPSRGIDPSYAFAMNQAVARHLSFGREIVFTYGPYASIGTRMYDPVTDRRMMLGSLLLGVCYVTGLMFVARGRRRYLLAILLFFFATFASVELLLLSYPFLLVLCVFKQAGHDDADLNWRQLAAAVVMWFALGLLPVVKGTFLVPFAASIGLPFVFLLYRKRYRYAFLSVLIPIAASLTFWLIAEQSLRNIPSFIGGNLALTSGYTEAMSTSWSVLPAIVGDGLVTLFLAISVLTLISVSRSAHFAASAKWTLSLLYALFLLVAFKHGFVTTSNLSTAFAALATFILIIGLLHLDRVVVWSLGAAIVLTAGTSIIRDPVLGQQVHQRFGVGAAWTGGAGRTDILAFCLRRAMEAYSRSTYKRTWSTYTGAWKGAVSRMVNDDLETRFAAAKSNIKSSYPLPVLEGSADIYQYDQSVLLASDNAWNPRPVLQGYTAYTPALARLDEQHLRGRNAPDWVFFDLQTIDGRLPSLDDGLSWPALLDNYTFVSNSGQFVVMRKNHALRPSSHYDNVATGKYKTGATIVLPNTEGLIFAQLDLKPTLIGRLLTELFNPPELHIVVGLQSGKTKSFRVISNMTRTDVLLSPLVSSTGEFADLMAGGGHSLDEDRVRTISVAPSYGGSLYWSGTYALTLKRYVGVS